MAEPNKPAFIRYRKNDSYAVWDDRGLTLRQGSKVKSFRFEDSSLGDHVSGAEEAQRSLPPVGLSGSRRIGQRVYFLGRWAGSKPYEALIQVDLEDRAMKPKVLGRFEGLTGASLPIDDRLFLINGGVGAVTRRESDWGVASYSYTSRSFDFVSVGEHLLKWYPSGLFVQETAYKSRVGGLLNLQTLQAQPLFEDRNDCEWLDGKMPPIELLRHSSGQTVRNCESGLEETFSDKASIRRTKEGLLAWSPAEKPQHAVLLGYSSWNRLASWNESGLRPQHERARAKRRL